MRGNRAKDGASGDLSGGILRHCLTWPELVVSTEAKRKGGGVKDKHTKCLSAVYDHNTLFVATLSPACLMSMLMTARKKSLTSFESALFATQPGPATIAQRIIRVGRWIRAMLYSLVENKRAMSCSYRMSRIRAMALSSFETADMA